MKRPRILLTRRWPDAVEQRLARDYDMVVDSADRPLSARQLRAAMSAFDALCPTVSDRIDTAILSVPNACVRMIGNFGVGTDNIDLEAARHAGIAVSNTPGVLTEATADIALLLLLTAARRGGEGERELRAGAWSGWRPTHLLGMELSGKRLGLVGFGRIAQAVARRARHGFGMAIHYYNRSPADPAVEKELGATRHVDLDTLLASTDIVSLHVPGGAETHHLIDARRLALLRSDAILINTARGTVIDEAALADALANRTIAAAGLDVYEREPAVHPALLRQDNAVLLPHLGSATIETRSAMGHKVADNLDAFFGGRPLPDPVISPPSA
ncbi:D-glycerate dehydrogenase [Sphingobium sp. HBC34]|uniref:D-glycerate dehydrogenase n=1 Tax=Sphingobium cyanobacteriorum TaxID=3063954 RepID=A0ABT8ZPI5_9SPHN|nr:D-glycerate dehydrogenase [Sphingobium sp. HBC34]MDO7836358.1 D-glycerate dehydrogenase [Sphingobium sp. HBC34]